MFDFDTVSSLVADLVLELTGKEVNVEITLVDEEPEIDTLVINPLLAIPAAVPILAINPVLNLTETLTINPILTI
jgi:hypothetical protein